MRGGAEWRGRWEDVLLAATAVADADGLLLVCVVYVGLERLRAIEILFYLGTYEGLGFLVLLI